VITAPSLRLDLEADRARLDETVARLKPRLLVLDPFVRLHRIDENVSGDVAPLLAFLRELQRRHAVAVILVHHARKGAGAIRAGQALRGSSEFHAWGDSNLYLPPRQRRSHRPDRRASRRRRHARRHARTRSSATTPSPSKPSRTISQTEQSASRAESVDQRITAALADGGHQPPAIRRSARILPRSHHHPLRTPRRHDRRRPHRQIVPP
jgi:hypothetical protein